MRESKIEASLTEGAAKLGGWALKWVSPGNAGVPDRLIVVPTQQCPCCGRTGYVKGVELKAPGEVPRPLQVRQMDRLRSSGLECDWTDSREGVDRILAELRSRQ